MTELSSSIVYRERKHFAECDSTFEIITLLHRVERIVEVALYHCTSGQELPRVFIELKEIQISMSGYGTNHKSWMECLFDQIVVKFDYHTRSYTVDLPWKRYPFPLAPPTPESYACLSVSDIPGESFVAVAPEKPKSPSTCSLSLMLPQDCPPDEPAPEPHNGPLHARQQHDHTRGAESPGTHVHTRKEEVTSVDVEDSRYVEVLHIGSKIFAAGTVQVLVAMHKRSRVFEMIVVATESRAELGRFYVRYDGLLSVIDQQVIQDRLRYATASMQQDSSTSIGSLLRATTLAVMAEHLLENLVVLRDACGVAVAQVRSDALNERALVTTAQPANVPRLQWLQSALALETIEEVPDTDESCSHGPRNTNYLPPPRKQEQSSSSQLWQRSAYDEDDLPERKHKPARAQGFLLSLLSAVFGQRESRIVPGGESEDGKEDSPKGLFQPFYNVMRALSHKSGSRHAHEEKKAASGGPYKLFSSTSTMSLATASSGDPTSVHSRSTSRPVPVLALSGVSNF